MCLFKTRLSSFLTAKKCALFRFNRCKSCISCNIGCLQKSPTCLAPWFTLTQLASRPIRRSCGVGQWLLVGSWNAETDSKSCTKRASSKEVSNGNEYRENDWKLNDFFWWVLTCVVISYKFFFSQRLKTLSFKCTRIPWIALSCSSFIFIQIHVVTRLLLRTTVHFATCRHAVECTDRNIFYWCLVLK